MTPDQAKRIQRRIGVTPDGQWGPISDAALWRVLDGCVEPAIPHYTPGTTNPVRVSPAGIALMHEFEGCRLEAYPDPGSRDGNPWTIGWGSTGPGIAKGVRWTQEQADARFEDDLARFALGVVRLLGGARTPQPMFDALTSFAYNVGIGALRDSTLLRAHKAGDYARAAGEFRRWRFNDGKEMKGLARRRAAEEALYRKGMEA